MNRDPIRFCTQCGEENPDHGLEKHISWWNDTIKPLNGVLPNYCGWCGGKIADHSVKWKVRHFWDCGTERINDFKGN